MSNPQSDHDVAKRIRKQAARDISETMQNLLHVSVALLSDKNIHNLPGLASALNEAKFASELMVAELQKGLTPV